jgi:hypothetical protein
MEPNGFHAGARRRKNGPRDHAQDRRAQNQGPWFRKSRPTPLEDREELLCHWNEDIQQDIGTVNQALGSEG